MKQSDKIQVALMDWVTASTADFAIPNYFFGRWEADLLKVSKSLMITEYEIKCSRADFRKDFEKETSWSKRNKHDETKSGKRVNRFYFVCPKGLIQPHEVPFGYGLIWYLEENGGIPFHIKKQCKLLSKEPKATPEQLRHMACNLHLKLVSAKRKLNKLTVKTGPDGQ